jgi:hypothetical protein
MLSICETRVLELLKPVLLGVLVPGTVALILFILLGRWRKDRPIGTLALALGYFAGQFVVAGLPDRYPVVSTEWIPFIALAATMVALIAAHSKLPAIALWGLRFLLLASILGVLLRKQIAGQWTPTERTAYLLAIACAGLDLFAVLDRLVRQPLRIGSPLMLTALTAASSAALVQSGSLLLGQLNGVLTATLGAGLVAACFFPGFILDRGAVTLVASLQIVFWICGYFFSDLPAVSIGLLALAPILVLLERRWIDPRLKAWQALLVHLAVLLIPLGLAVAQASGPSAPDDVDSTSSSEYDF